MPSDLEAAAVAVGSEPEESQGSPEIMSVVSQYLATIGRKGGIEGGKERAKALSPERRVEIARKAADTRWKKAK